MAEAFRSPAEALVLDSFHGRMTDRVKKAVPNAECDLVVIPGGMLQPIDVSLNKPCKDHVGALYEWVRTSPERPPAV